jgi:prepilin-type N-terminal cleavage/methylation domain-containing protein
MNPELDHRAQDGFTLIELLVVLVIIGVLLAIAVPSYLGFKDRAGNAAAKANLRSAMPAAESYYSDNRTYVGMGFAQLQAIDAGISSTLSVASASASTYCLTDTVEGKTWSVEGPGAPPIGYKPNATCA